MRIFVTIYFILLYTTGYCEPQNLLQNPGFETGDMSGWEVSGNALVGVAEHNSTIENTYFKPSKVIAHSGKYAAFNLTANFKRINSILSQEIEVSPDTNYGVEFRMLHGHPSQPVKTYPNILIDGKPITVSITGGNGYGTSTDDYQLVKGEFVTGQDKKVVRVSFVLQASGLMLAGMSYDDFLVFRNNPIVNVSPTVGIPGTVVSICGYNYQPQESIEIQADTSIITTDVNKNGAFSTTLIIPSHPSGTLTIIAIGTNSHKTATTLFNLIPRKDFGDAPNSSLYIMNTGYFGAPNDFASPDFFTYQAHFPVVSHRIAGMEYLGNSVSIEAGIYDLQYDEDNVPNINPYKGIANQDGHDDGLIMPVNLIPGATNTVEFQVTTAVAAPIGLRYVNILFDWNQDGRWGGNEWAVRNQHVDVLPGNSRLITSTPFMAGTTTGGCWMRMTLTRQPIEDTNWEGSGSFEYGETEDYLINISAKSDLWINISAPENVYLGQVITYRMEYGNQGNALANKVQITTEIPFGLTYLPDTDTTADKLSWNIDRLYPDDKGALEARFRVEPWAITDSRVLSTASISCDMDEAVYDNNIAVYATRVLSPVGDNIISGRVVTTDNHNPVLSALITAIQHEPFRIAGTAITDANGKYEITGLPDGKYTVSAKLDGYADRCFQGWVKVNSGTMAKNIDISMLPIKDDSSIVFCSRLDDGDYNLYDIQTDGTERKQLTNSIQMDTVPSVSSDGKHVVFIRGSQWNYGDIWIIDASGRGEKQLTPTITGNASSPSFSPDNKRIVFCKNNAICMINIDGTGYQELLSGGEYPQQQMSDPAFSPDGAEIVFVMTDEKGLSSDLYLIDIDNRKLFRLTQSVAMEYAPSFSPDGSMIMFTQQQDSGDTGIWIMNRDGTNERKVFTDSFFGKFSSDGKQAVFISARGGNHDVYTADIDGGERQQLTTYQGVDTYPSWALKLKPSQVQTYVWPGDTNNDGVVNELDVIPIAINWGKTGLPREGSAKWGPRIAIVWDPFEATYADANGDGEVKGNDILFISMNWGRSHPVLKGMQSPAISLEEIDHAKHLQKYIAMYEVLDQVAETEGVAELKQALQGLIDAAIKTNNTSSILMQNYPNPFNPECWIPYELSEQTHVVIRIYNISGQLIRVLDEGIQSAGKHIRPEQAAYWDGKNEDGDDVASGVYLYQMQVGSQLMTMRAVVCK